MSETENLSLLMRTAEGDAVAFRQLYDQTSGKLYAVSLGMMKRRDLAEDAVQDAFVRIWHNAGEYRAEKGVVLTWMISIVRYRCLDLLRSSKARREHLTDGDLDLVAEPEDHDTPEGALNAGRARVHIDQCLDELEDQQRHAIQLAYFRGMTHQEVCSQLDLPLGSVKSWIRRGLQQLKRCLE